MAKKEQKTLKLMLKPKDKKPSGGRMCMWYGKTGVGKTISTCFTKNKDKKILFVPNGYDPEEVLQNMGMDTTNFFVADKKSTGIETFFEWREVFMNPESYADYDVIIFDDISIMLAAMLNDVSDEEKGRIDKENAETLTELMQIDMGDYNTTNLLLMRLGLMLRELAESDGKEVHFTAHSNEQFGLKAIGDGRSRKLVRDPDAEYDRAPQFASDKVTMKFAGLLDIIGYVRPKTDAEKEKYVEEFGEMSKYAPMVEMIKGSRNMGKWRGNPKYSTAPHHADIDSIMARSREAWR